MDGLLAILFAAPLAGGILTTLAGHRSRRQEALLQAAATLASGLCVAIMGFIVYRRFFLPLGAIQLRLVWGDWFVAEPLVADVSLRMDTVAGVICLVLSSISTVWQAYAAWKGWDQRLRGMISVGFSAVLLFVLADNLIPVFASLVAVGPLLAMANAWRLKPELGGERYLQVLLFHGAGDASMLVGILILFRALGTLSFRGMGVEIATQSVAAPDPTLQIGVVLLLLGVGIRSGLNVPDAVAPLFAMVYLGWRLDPVVRVVPGGVLVAVVIFTGGLAMANLAGFVHASDETARIRRMMSEHAWPFFREFLDALIIVGVFEGAGRLAVGSGRRLVMWSRRPWGAAALVLAAVAAAGLIAWRAA